jgi:hypothetical protein
MEEWMTLKLENLSNDILKDGLYEFCVFDYRASHKWTPSEKAPLSILVSAAAGEVYRYRRLQPKQLSPKEKLTKEIECILGGAPIYAFQQSGIEIESLVGYMLPKIWEYITLHCVSIPPPE